MSAHFNIEYSDFATGRVVARESYRVSGYSGEDFIDVVERRAEHHAAAHNVEIDIATVGGGYRERWGLRVRPA